MTSLRFDHTRLPNGLTVIGEHNPAAQSTAVGYFVNTGSRDEHDRVAGVSHFLEHMVFKGTARRTAEDINREFDELGARNNAYTSEEHTVYYGAVLPEHQRRLLDLLTDMMRPALRQDDFDVEKQVILEEIAMYEDQPNMRVFELGTRRFFRQHPLGNSVLGSRDSIGPLPRERMVEYLRRRYAPNNMLLALAGAYDWEAALVQIQEATSGWESQPTTREYPAMEPAQGSEIIEDDRLKRAHIGFWAPGPSHQSELRYAAALLASCLGDAAGSRLYWDLVDKGEADVAQLWHDAGDRAGAFMGYASTAASRAGDVLARVQEALRLAQTEPPSAEEWKRAQHKIATSLTLHAETPFGRLMSLGNAYLYNRAYVSLDEVLERLARASLDDAAAVLAERPFERLFALTLSPADGSES